MGPRPKIYQHVTDPPIRLGDNEKLIGKHVIQGGTLIGRVLFTKPSPCVYVHGVNVEISGCLFESLYCSHEVF